LIILAAPEAKPTPPPDPLMERMGQAIRLVQGGEFNTALEQFIDPAIALFEKEYAGLGVRIYCLRNATETVFYLAQAGPKGGERPRGRPSLRHRIPSEGLHSRGPE
jgi:hypothetical protein